MGRKYGGGPLAFIGILFLTLQALVPRVQAAASLPAYNRAALCAPAGAWPVADAPCRIPVLVQITRAWTQWTPAGKGGTTLYWLDVVTANGAHHSLEVSHDLWDRAHTTDLATLEFWHGQITNWTLRGTIVETDASPPGSLRFLILAGLVALAVILLLTLLAAIPRRTGYRRDPYPLAEY